MFLSDVCLSDVCLSVAYIGPNSRTERPRKTKIGTYTWQSLATICPLETDTGFPSVLWHYWLGDRKGIRPERNWVLVCWWWLFDWSFAHLIAPVVIITTSIILSSNKIQNGDILVLANPGPRGKWPLKWRERERLTRVQQFVPIPIIHFVPIPLPSPCLSVCLSLKRPHIRNSCPHPLNIPTTTVPTNHQSCITQLLRSC